MNEWEWQLLEEKTALDHLEISGVEVRTGSRVRLLPRQGGDVMDIAQSVVYLAAPTGKFITGEVLTVDGGRQNWGEDWPGGIPDYFRVPGR